VRRKEENRRRNIGDIVNWPLRHHVPEHPSLFDVVINGISMRHLLKGDGRVRVRRGIVVSFLGALAACQTPPPAVVVVPEAVPVSYQPPPPAEPAYEEVGQASFYGAWHQGKKTASGETFDANKLTAAHPTLPLGTEATVTNLENGKSVDVTINDRGPYAKDRAIDLSAKAAKRLGMTKRGVAPVKIEATRESGDVEAASDAK